MRLSLPSDWYDEPLQDQKISLLLHGIESACFVFWNGELLGFFKDSRLPSEFSVPPHLLQELEEEGGEAVLHVVVEYLNTRKQFDHFIGSYQSLKHPTVDILLDGEGCKSHVYHAASVMAEGDRAATDVAVRMAKAQASEAFAYAGDRAVQFHGGFGFTYECDAQLYLRRALWCQHQFGDERYHRQKLAPALLD